MVKVIPPGATETTTPELVFEYQYDNENKLTGKKVPGRGWTYYWYNNKDLLAAVQDPNLLAQNKYLAYQYDINGRQIKSGLVSSVTNLETPSFTTVLTEDIYGTTSFEKDKIKTTKSNIAGTANFITNTLTYDTRGRIQQSTFNTHTYNTANKTVTYAYDNADNVLSTSWNMPNMPDGTYVYSESSTYDHRGRIKTDVFTHTANTKTVGAYTYNFRNELTRLSQGFVSGSTFLQDIDYTYKSNGLLQAINQPLANGATSGDLFYEELYYESPIATTGSVSQKNGNIANAKWQKRGSTAATYAYTYDVYNQVTVANYWDYNTSNALVSTTKYDETFSYDVRGNLSAMTRYNHTPALIDNMLYAYSSNTNRLLRINDSSANTTGFNQNGQSSSGTVYTYDNNGNLTNDLYKNVSSISNNHLDLPTIIIRTDGSKIEMLYDADGNLLQRKSYGPGGTLFETRDFIGNFEFVNSVLDVIHHAQGDYKRVSAGVYRFEYTIADHLGNTRVHYTDVDNNGSVSNSEVQDWNDYYSYGMEHTGTYAAGGYRYKFNGIERVDGYADFAFYRGLDPVTGRWGQVDPSAESLYSMAPYQSMGNNPIRYKDPNGDFIPQLVGAIVGGTVNLVDQALKGNVTSLGEGLAYFGTGAAAGIAISFGQVGLARGITVGGNKITQAVTGKFSFSELDSPGDIASLVLDVGTDLLSPGLTQALSKPITKAITARVLAKAIDDAVVSGGGEFIKRTLSKEAAEELAKNGIEWSLVPTEEFVVTASRVATTGHVNYVAGVTARSFGKVVGEGTVNVGNTISAIKSGTLNPAGIYNNIENHSQLLGKAKGYWEKYELVGYGRKSPLRLIKGAKGELFLSPDHYKTIIPLGGL